MSRHPSATEPRLRLLNHPRPLKVEAENSGQPLAVFLSSQRLTVDSVVESWRIDDEWWREKPVSRLYRRVLLEDGRVVDVYQSLASGRWFRQAY